MRKLGAIALAIGIMFSLSSCVKSAEEVANEQLAKDAQRAKTCKDAGGRYVLTMPAGYMNASYWCMWDEK